MKSRATKKAASLVSALTLCVSLLCSGMAFRAAAAGEKVLTPDSTWVLDAYSPTKTPTLEGQKITNTSPISASMGTAAAPAANSSVIRIPDVDFGADGYAEAVLSLGVPSYTSGTTGRIAMMLGEVYNEVVALFSVSGDAAADHTASFTRKITGVHDVVLVMETAAGDLNSLTLQGAPAADLPALSTSDYQRSLLYPAEAWEVPSGPSLQNGDGRFDYLGDYKNIYYNPAQGDKRVTLTFNTRDFSSKGIDQIGFLIGKNNQGHGSWDFRVYVAGTKDGEDTASHVAGTATAGQSVTTGQIYAPEGHMLKLDGTYTGRITIQFHNSIGNMLLFGVLIPSDADKVARVDQDDITPETAPPALTEGLVLSPSDTWELGSYSSKEKPELSEDGKYVAYTRPASDKTDEPNSSVIRIPDVDFGENGYAQIQLALGVPSFSEGQTKNSIRIVLDEIYNTAVASIKPDQSGSAVYTADLKKKVTGTHDVIIIMETAAANLYGVAFKGTPAADLPPLTASDLNRKIVLPDQEGWESGNPDRVFLRDPSSQFDILGENPYCEFLTGDNPVYFTVDFDEYFPGGVNSIGLYWSSANEHARIGMLYIDGVRYDLTKDDLGTEGLTTGRSFTPHAAMLRLDETLTGEHEIQIRSTQRLEVFGLLLGYEEPTLEEQEAMERTLKDEDTGISIRGTKLYQAELEVTEESDADELQKLQQALAKDDLKIARVQAYTLNVTKNGQAMTPETDYYLYLPVDMDSLTDSQDYALYYQDEQGALTEVSFMIMGGQAAAVVRDFGTYVLAVTEQEEDDKPVPSDPESDPGSNPESDPGSNPESETGSETPNSSGSESPAPETGAALPTAAVLLSLLAAGTIVVTKRKK